MKNLNPFSPAGITKMATPESRNTSVLRSNRLQRHIILGTSWIQLGRPFHQSIIIRKVLPNLRELDRSAATNDPFGSGAIRPDFFHSLNVVAAKGVLVYGSTIGKCNALVWWLNNNKEMLHFC